MEENIQVIGIMGNNMEREYTKINKEKVKKVFGKMDKESNG